MELLVRMSEMVPNGPAHKYPDVSIIAIGNFSNNSSGEIYALSQWKASRLSFCCNISMEATICHDFNFSRWQKGAYKDTRTHQLFRSIGDYPVHCNVLFIRVTRVA